MSKHLGEPIIPEQLNAKAKPLHALCAMKRSDVAEAVRKDRNKSPPKDSAGRDPSRPTVTGFDGESTHRATLIRTKPRSKLSMFKFASSSRCTRTLPREIQCEIDITGYTSGGKSDLRPIVELEFDICLSTETQARYSAKCLSKIWQRQKSAGYVPVNAAMWASFMAECMWAATSLSDKEETRQRLVMYHQFYKTPTLVGAVQARLTYLNTKEEPEFCGTISEILRQRVQHANLGQHQTIDEPTGRPLRAPVHVFSDSVLELRWRIFCWKTTHPQGRHGTCS